MALKQGVGTIKGYEIEPLADLRGADLSFSELAGADLTGADLRGADLSNCNLASALLVDADLEEADFTGSNLTSADLRGAFGLCDAFLSRANFADAKVDAEQVPYIAAVYRELLDTLKVRDRRAPNSRRYGR
jgi:uncharacterized protein YjbI with pentapeptide repeats